MKKAVLIHAQFLLPSIWESVMWGDPSCGTYGVIPKGLQLAERFEVDLIYLCSGIPIKGGREFSPSVGDFIATHSWNLPPSLRVSSTFNPKIVQDDEAQNTCEEIVNAASVFHLNDIEQVIMVTVPKHLPRVSKEAQLIKQKGLLAGIDILTTASDVDFPEAKLADVAIIEPSHRHDTPKNLAFACANATIKLMMEGQDVYAQYETEWRKLLVQHGQVVS